MRSNLVLAIMVGALLCLSLLVAWLSVRHHFSLKEYEKLQGQYLRLNTTLRAAQSLAAQCVQYSKQHPDINPILEPFLKPVTNTPPVALPPAPASNF